MDTVNSNSSSPTPVLSMIVDATDKLVVINVNVQLPFKLAAVNYPPWRVQFNSLLHGYDLFGFVDGSHPCPTPKLMNPDTIESISHPAYVLWFRKDQFLLNAIVGSVSPNLVYLLATATTSMEAWQTLESIYAKPSQGRITTHHTNLMAPEQGDKSIMEYMQDIKRNVDALALMGQKVDWEDLVLRIIKGLNLVYDLVGMALNILQDSVTFEELFEKLLNEEAHCKLPKSSNIFTSNLATALVASSSVSTFTKNGSKYTNKNTRPFNNTNKSFRPPQSQQWTPRPHHAVQSTGYQWKCQLCRITGHSAPQCQFFPQSALAYLPSPLPPGSSPQSYPSYSAHSTMHHGISYDPQEWVIYSGASHHVTTDLANLSLHSPYTVNDNVVIGNGAGPSHGGYTGSGRT